MSERNRHGVRATVTDGDPGGHVRAATRFLRGSPRRDPPALPNGRTGGAPYKVLPMHKQVASVARQELTMLASFVEVWLAKRATSTRSESTC